VVAVVVAATILVGAIPVGVSLVGVLVQHVTVTDRGLISRSMIRTVCLPWEWIEQFDVVPSGQLSAAVAARLIDGKTVVLGPMAAWTNAAAQAQRDSLAGWQRRLTDMK
jgi:hypothetical protein